MVKFITNLLITAVIAYALSYLLPGIYIDSFRTGIVLALVLAILNAIVKPLLVLLTLPITVLTLGLFLFVINALIILLAANFIHGFAVSGFWPALLFSLALSLARSLLVRERREKA